MLLIHYEAAGGRQALADAMKVSLSTVYRWIKGATPAGPHLHLLVQKGWASIVQEAPEALPKRKVRR